MAELSRECLLFGFEQWKQQVCSCRGQYDMKREFSGCILPRVVLDVPFLFLFLCMTIWYNKSLLFSHFSIIFLIFYLITFPLSNQTDLNGWTLKRMLVIWLWTVKATGLLMSWTIGYEEGILWLHFT